MVSIQTNYLVPKLGFCHGSELRQRLGAEGLDVSLGSLRCCQVAHDLVGSEAAPARLEMETRVIIGPEDEPWGAILVEVNLPAEARAGHR